MLEIEDHGFSLDLLNADGEIVATAGNWPRPSAHDNLRRFWQNNLSETSMPTISVFYGIVIQMFWQDHAPPHFHALYAEHEALIDLRTPNARFFAPPSDGVGIRMGRGTPR